MLAKDLMCRDPIFVTRDTSLRRAIRLMIHKGISGLPVIDDDGKLCGMLTEGDVIEHSELNFHTPSSTQAKDEAFYQRYIKSHGATAGDCMTSPVVSVGPTATLLQVVAKLREHRIKRVPVLEDGKLVGIISRRDVLHAAVDGPELVAQGDEALRLAIETRLRVELGLRLAKTDLRVHQAVVELVGSFDSAAQRQAMRLLVQGIAGVAGVRFLDEAQDGKRLPGRSI